MAETKQRLKRIPMSKEEFEKLPEGPPFYDYIGGEAIEVNRPSGKHQKIIVRVCNRLMDHLYERRLGDVWADIDVLLPTGDVVGPDLSLLLAEHLDRYDEEKGDIIGVPDLVVEVLSPTTREYDRVEEKMRVYHRAGVPWVWLIDQETLTIEEFRWTQDGYLLVQAVKAGETFRPTLFPDLDINLKTLLGE
ncbi:MAG: Uma2 family endonuclease [Armatimonadota bacterium]|nr:Uma2 family endonuclease [Armatimonadota bacterium]MDT7971808.1 Uma2 family endonuclease [Armatimonadota bacterium]